jgi:anti-sigma factor RsiW
MTNDRRHFDEELSELVDNRLDGSARAEVEAHLAVCPECRARLEALRWLKSSLAAGTPAADVPSELVARVKRALDDEDRRPTRAFWSSRPFLVAASVALVVAAAAAFFLSRSARVPTVEAVAEDFRAFRAERLALDLKTAKPQELEEHFRRRGIPFPARVFDFGMMKYDLVGGRVHAQAGRPAALYAYRASAGSLDDVIVCQMFPGSLRELPTPAAVRHHKDIAFHVFRSGELTLVFWQEGDIICVLTAGGDPETVVQFAFAKAVKL